MDFRGFQIFSNWIFPSAGSGNLANHAASKALVSRLFASSSTENLLHRHVGVLNTDEARVQQAGGVKDRRVSNYAVETSSCLRSVVRD